MSVVDAMHRSTDSSLDGMMMAARRARAGKLVWGRVWVTRDSMKVRAGVYDAIDGIPLREKEISGPRNLLEKQPGVLRVLAADLLRLDGAPASARSGDVGTRSFAAWRAYQEGQRALTTWRVLAAIDAFERAVAADPDYAHAQTWLAQLLLWRDRANREMGPACEHGGSQSRGARRARDVDCRCAPGHPARQLQRCVSCVRRDALARLARRGRVARVGALPGAGSRGRAEHREQDGLGVPRQHRRRAARLRACAPDLPVGVLRVSLRGRRQAVLRRIECVSLRNDSRQLVVLRHAGHRRRHDRLQRAAVRRVERNTFRGDRSVVRSCAPTQSRRAPRHPLRAHAAPSGQRRCLRVARARARDA